MKDFVRLHILYETADEDCADVQTDKTALRRLKVVSHHRVRHTHYGSRIPVVEDEVSPVKLIHLAPRPLHVKEGISLLQVHSLHGVLSPRHGSPCE